MNKGAKLNRYLLDIDKSTLLTDVESFSGEEGLCTPYRYVIRFTSPEKAIPASTLLKQSASLTLRQPNLRHSGLLDEQPAWLAVRKISGVITAMQQLKTSQDEALYEIVLAHPLALLANRRRHAIYQAISVPQLVRQILNEHDFAGYQIDMDRLFLTYPEREMIVQWGETDLAFIQRLLAEVGIWFRFALHPENDDIVVMTFADDQRGYVFNHTIDVCNPAGSTGEAYSIHQLQTRHTVMPAEVYVKHYDYRRDDSMLLNQTANACRANTTTQGHEYHYADIHHQAGDRYDNQDGREAESSWFYARLRHERLLNSSTTVTAIADDPLIVPGVELRLNGQVPDALAQGLVVTGIQSSASRSNPFQVALIGIPYSEQVCFRPEPLARPRIIGTVPARISGLNRHDTLAHLDKYGRYYVKFDFDLAEWKKGYESMAVRLARPYAGNQYGFHFPLLDNTEVGIAFEGGDPERPYIDHALHDAINPDLVTDRNATRNVLRTLRNNKLRMEDKAGQEHIKLATEYGKSQLNLGHLVDAQGKARGEGLEARTDLKAAIRAAQGIMLTTEAQAQAQGKQREMSSIIQQLETALALAQTLQESSRIAGADAVDTGDQSALQDAINDLNQPTLVGYADAGLAQLSAQSLQLSAGKDLLMTAAQNGSINILKSFSLAVGEGISAFARKLGMKLLAASGDISVQAQRGKLGLLADQELMISSVNGQLLLNAKAGLQLSCGGGGLRINADGTVEVFSPARITEKAPMWNYEGGQSVKTMTPVFEKETFARRFALYANGDPEQILANCKFRLTQLSGEVQEGITDNQGCSPLLDMHDLQRIKKLEILK